MTQDLVRSKLETSLKAKSLSDLMKKTHAPETVWLALDTSGSMNGGLRNGKSQIEALGEVVRDIEKNAGTVKKIVFGGMDDVHEVVSVPTHAVGGTPLHKAIVLSKQKGCNRLIVISDGIPDDKTAAMDAATKFEGKIDVVYVGNPNDSYGGEEFLKKLAAATGGTEFAGDLSQPLELAGKIMGLIGEGSED